MNDQKNKQQQPHGNQKDQNKEKEQNKPGQQGGSQQHGGGQSGSGQQTAHNTAHKSDGTAEKHKQERMGSDIENPDQENEPGKKTNISDDPEQTKKKVPNMHKDH
jgi:hypothetical protein